jgi:hypothetical protein
MALELLFVGLLMAVNIIVGLQNFDEDYPFD